MSQLTCFLLAWLGTGQLAWWTYQLCVAGLMIGMLVAWSRQFATGRFSRCEALGVYVVFVFAIGLLWLPNYPRPELNPDESQWIAQANNLTADPLLWFSYFLPSNWGRALTIFPLSFGGMLAGESLGYDGTRLVAVLMWSGFACVFFIAVRSVFGRQTGLWASALVAIAVGRMGFSDFVAYNSELAVILLCMASFALVAKVLNGQATQWSAFAAGALVAMVPFAKNQGLPMAFVLCAGALALLTWQKQWRSAVFFVLGTAACWLSGLMLIVATGNFAEWVSMMRVLQDYAVQGTHWRAGGWFYQLRFFRSLLLRSELTPVFASGCVAVPLLGIAALMRWWKPTSRQIGVVAWCVLMGAAAAAAVYYPRQQFAHYGLLLLFPCSLLLSAAIGVMLDHRRLGYLGLAGMFLWVLLPPGKARDAHEGVAQLEQNCAAPIENVLSQRIRDLASPGDRLLIWGWRNSYFVETGLLQGSRLMYPVFATGSYSTKDDNLRRYADDLDLLKPELILEWVGDDALYFNGPRAVHMQDVVELGRRLAESYELVAVEGNQKLYRRREELGEVTQ